MKMLFELEDIEPQLTLKQKHQLEFIIEESKRHPERFGICVQIGEFGKKIIVFPSGKMYSFEKKGTSKLVDEI